jgi:hypothetical protein
MEDTKSTPSQVSIQNSPNQPWKQVWQKQAAPQVKTHTISYGFQKGKKMVVQGSAGNGVLEIIYDTESK